MKFRSLAAALIAPMLSDMTPEPKSAITCNSLTIGDAELIDDLADVGALPYGRGGYGRGGGGYGRHMQRGGYGAQRGYPARRLVPQIPGAPMIGIRLQPLGFPVVTFTATSGTALTTTTRPQRPFKPLRLVVDLARTGATATGLVTITGLFIGTNNQFVSTAPIGAAAFAATAFDVNMQLAACTTALDVTVQYAISAAPAMTDNVAIATTMFGEAVG